ncbi:MAG: CDGSH iron-sulfur domain-containing protein [Candidatus Paceibacterota bacterium]|jgi:CDGSH-type Zn-finger protein
MDKEEKTPTFAERLNLGSNGRQCVCGKSKKHPLCDGSHSQE